MSTNKSIIKSAGIIGFYTFLSRVLGFIRDIVIAYVFGTAAAAQAFVVAFKIPNLIREMIGEGASNAAFVPIFSEYLVQKEKKEQLWDIVRVILSLFLIILVGITVLGIIFAPWIVKIIAPGFIGDSYKLDLTIRLTRMMFPYLVFIGLTAFGMGVLNSFGSFAVPAMGPCLLNIALIVSALYARNYFREPVFGLVVGVLAGGFLQFIINLPPIFRRGFRFKGLTFQFKHPVVVRVFKLLLPRAFGSVLYQLNVFIDTICASLGSIVGEGAVAAIYYASRVLQFPLAIFGIAISTASLPVMSKQVASQDIEKLKDTISFSLRNIFLILFPASIVLLVLPLPIVRILFQRGNFSAYSTSITSWALLFYGLGLSTTGMAKILASGFYSLQDTATPVKIGWISLVINIILNLVLMFPLKVGGLALASSISSIVNFFLLLHILQKKIGKLNRDRIKKSFGRIILAGLIMGLALNFIWQGLFLNWTEITRFYLALFLASIIFIASCLVLGVEELKGFITWVFGLKRR